MLFAGCAKTKEKSDDGITLHTGFQTEYLVGDSLNLDNGKIKCTEDGKSTIVVLQEDMVTGFDTKTAGEKEMLVTYHGYQLLVKYSVIEPYDIKTGVIYIIKPSKIAEISNYANGYSQGDKYYSDPSDKYDYIYFSEKYEMIYNVAKSYSEIKSSVKNAIEAGENGTTMNRKLVGNAYTYTFTDSEGSGDAIIVTALKGDSISVVCKVTGAETKESKTFTSIFKLSDAISLS